MPASSFCIKAFSETNTTEDLKRFDVPTLILHGDDNQIVPIGASTMLASRIVKGAQLRSINVGMVEVPVGVDQMRDGLRAEIRKGLMRR